MGAGRHTSPTRISTATTSPNLAKTADLLTVGDNFREDVSLGPPIDDKQLARVRGLVERSVAAGRRLWPAVWPLLPADRAR